MISEDTEENEGRMIMKKKIVGCMLGMSMIAALMTGCMHGETEEKSVELNETVSEQTVESEGKSETINEQDVLGELEAETENTVETDAAVMIENVEEKKYEDFLNDEELLFFDKYNQYEFLEDETYFEEGKGYNLSEIIDVLAEH